MLSEFQLRAHAVTGSQEILIRVIDQNDNRPVFTQAVFQGRVREASRVGVCFLANREHMLKHDSLQLSDEYSLQ